MPGEALLDYRKPLNDICSIPDKIISVYSLEQHVWADSNSPEARQIREPEVRTIDEFQIDPVRPFLNDIFRNMAAPYRPERRDQSIGQGYWVQAEFGSGKSHLLCFLSALALGTKEGWERVRDKEQKAGRGRRESLYRFWEEGLQAKSSQPNKGVFVIVKTLVGTGGGAVDPLAVVLSLGALAGAVGMTVLAAPVLPRLGSLAATVYSCGLAGAMLLIAGSVVGAVTGTDLLRMPSLTEFGALAYLAVMVTAVVCVAWFAAMDRLGTARTGLFNGVIPVAGLLAVTLLGIGQVTAPQAGGALAVLAGVLLGLTAGRTAQPAAGVGPLDPAPENASRR